MNESDQHTIAIATCNSPDVTDFTKTLTMFSNNDFIRADNGENVYFLFKKQEKGFMYFRMPK